MREVDRLEMERTDAGLGGELNAKGRGRQESVVMSRF